MHLCDTQGRMQSAWPPLDSCAAARARNGAGLVSDEVLDKVVSRRLAIVSDRVNARELQPESGPTQQERFFASTRARTRR